MKITVEFDLEKQSDRLVAKNLLLGGIYQDITIDHLGLTYGTNRILDNEDIRTLKKITDYTPMGLLRISGLGRKRLNEIIDKVREYGLELKED